ncbi:hypothetical protein [Allofournierella massiliensis]|uniref:Uncharacterized protein n=1 Tax=Allofournierella massiliensis TaxID=1650663 RepID=A0A4R1QJX7_9FIRM|nr:hypothetical protein [Fournierella massiliensis]TCL52971.1 hypothetical protein EDD77_13811 [Fournierella massiliensis]
MNNNQKAIKDSAQSIFSELALFSNAVTDFQKKAREISKEEYLTNEGIEAKTNEAKAYLVKRAVELSSSISLSLATIRKAAMAMEESFVISPELQAAITLTSAAGEKLDTSARDRMWKQFIGDNNALRSLKALFDSKGMYTKEMEKYIFNAEDQCNDLESSALDFKIQPGTNLNQTVAFGQKLEKFCELEGVELDKPFIQYLNAEDYSQFYTEQLRTAFGI